MFTHWCSDLLLVTTFCVAPNVLINAAYWDSSLRRRRSKPSVYSVCELVHNIVFESRRVAKKYVGVIDWLFSFTVCD